MNSPYKNIKRLSVALGILTWVTLLVLDLFSLISITNQVPTGIPPYLSQVFLNLFLLSLFVFFKFSTTRAESVNFTDLLWNVFVTGLLTTVVSLIIRGFFFLLGTSKFADNPLVINFFYHINLGLISAFLISTFIVWKRLILYQKNKRLQISWQIFEYAIVASIFFNFIEYEVFDTLFNIVFVLLFLMGLYLSANLKWVAYLNFKQKWKSILFILLVIVYLWYFFISLLSFSGSFILATDLLNQVFILALFSFIFLYAVFSLLVILFNLPTSSVFEKKLEEVINFQRLSQSISTGQNEEQVYEILIDSASSAVFADGAWLEINDEEEHNKLLITREIKKEAVAELKKNIRKSSIQRLLSSDNQSEILHQKLIASVRNDQFKSVMLFPLIVQQKHIGNLALLKEVKDSFTKEMVDIINTFVNQTCISIENFRLLNEALENERYKEELKIAQRVQQSLLPNDLEHGKDMLISAFSEAADEVGGDYYDSYRLTDSKIALIIGDVSGKGTSAAFNMSQMKGVFHSLVLLKPSPIEFVNWANLALSRCLEKASFITLSFFVIDEEKKEISFVRAGHCPTLYYSASSSESKYFKNKGLGLGILRNSNFSKYVEINNIKYSKGDIVLLYTDGIIEAKNARGEEYGYDRLEQLLLKQAKSDPQDIQKALLNDLYSFCEQKGIDDDYTAVIIKFLE